MENHVRITGDVIAGGIAFATILQWLPPIAAIASIVWCGMQMWDHRLGRLWRAKLRRWLA